MDLNVKVFLSNRLMIANGDGFIEVKLHNRKKDLIEGLGYIENGLVYIYNGELKSSNPKPGLYTKLETTKKGKEKLKRYFIGDEPDYKGIYPIDEVLELNVDAIFENLSSNPDDFIKPEDLETISTDRDIYIPIIKDSDDFLKVAIKKAITAKRINIKKKYKNQFTSQHQLTNMMSSLQGATKMSVLYYIYWANLLGLDWELSLYDNGKDPMNPLPEPIHLTSNEF